MYQLISGFINITDLNIYVEWQVHHLACQSTPASDLTFVYALIIGLL